VHVCSYWGPVSSFEPFPLHQPIHFWCLGTITWAHVCENYAYLLICRLVSGFAVPQGGLSITYCTSQSKWQVLNLARLSGLIHDSVCPWVQGLADQASSKSLPRFLWLLVNLKCYLKKLWKIGQWVLLPMPFSYPYCSSSLKLLLVSTKWLSVEVINLWRSNSDPYGLFYFSILVFGYIEKALCMIAKMEKSKSKPRNGINFRFQIWTHTTFLKFLSSRDCHLLASGAALF